MKILDRLAFIDKAIKRKNTGSNTELAIKMQVSERCVRNYIKILKNKGAPIHFSRDLNSYYYKEEGGFSFIFSKTNE